MKRRLEAKRLKVMEPPFIKGPVSEPLGCYKLAFESELAASNDKNAIKFKQRAYRCEMCHQWHLSKRDESTIRHLKAMNRRRGAS